MAREKFTKATDSYDSELRSLIRRFDHSDRLALNDSSMDNVLLSAVRYVQRTYRVDVVPCVVAFITADQPNEYGDHVFVEVSYSTVGWRTVLGGRIDRDEKRVNWSCYMD